MFNVFGFYKFKKLSSLIKNKKILQDFLLKNNIRGTVIISPEGMNGTISGKLEDIKKSKDKLKKLLLDGNLWAAYPAAISKSFKKTYKIFHERKKRYSGKSKMNLHGLFRHSARVFSVFKYKILIFSFIYSSIFFLLGPTFYFFIFILIVANISAFLISHNNKRKLDENFNSIISHIDTIKSN